MELIGHSVAGRVYTRLSLFCLRTPSRVVQRFADSSDEFAPQRELYFLALYRILEAGLIAALVFSPVSLLVDPESDPHLGTAVAVGYLLLATILLVWVVMSAGSHH